MSALLHVKANSKENLWRNSPFLLFTENDDISIFVRDSRLIISEKFLVSRYLHPIFLVDSSGQFRLHACMESW